MTNALSFKGPTVVNLSVLIPGAFVPFTDLHQKTLSFLRLYNSMSLLKKRKERKEKKRKEKKRKEKKRKEKKAM